MVQKNFEEEREQAQNEAENLTKLLQAHGYEVGSIDWELIRPRLANVPVNGVEIGDVLTLAGYQERGRLLEHVRYKLLEAKAQEVLQDKADATSWTRLERPSDAPPEIQSLWRIHLGEDDRPGINIVEIVRDDKRFYEYYPDGPQLGIYSFPVDKISIQAIHLIKENGGLVIYNPSAQRADDIQGRRQVTLPEGTQQFGESEEPMAPQRFRLPNGVELRLVPNWFTVDLSVADEK